MTPSGVQMGKPRFAWLPGLTMGTHSYGVTPALFQAPSLGSVKGGKGVVPSWALVRTQSSGVVLGAVDVQVQVVVL